MALIESDVAVPVIDKEWLREQFKLMDAQTGFFVDPTATPEKARALVIADGIRLEENLFSRDIIKMRYEDE